MAAGDDLTTAMGKAAKDVVCSVLEVNEVMNAFFFGEGYTGPGGGVIAPTPEELAENTRFRQQLCGIDTPATENAIPFSGGQCNGVIYRIRFGYQAGALGCAASSVDLNVKGPITGVYYTRLSGAPAGRQAWRMGVTSSFSGSQPGPTFADNTNLCNKPSLTFVQRQDGLPDTCGNLTTPPYGPWVPVSKTVNVTYTNFYGDNITKNTNFTILAPILNINGQLEIPVTFSLGGVTFDGTLELNGEFNIGSPSNPDKYPGPGEPDDPVDPPEEPSPDIPLTPGKRILGALVKVTGEVDDRTVIYGEDTPQLLVPDLGSFHWVFKVGSGEYWGTQIRLNQRDSFIPVPEGQLAETANVSVRPGLTAAINFVREP